MTRKFAGRLAALFLLAVLAAWAAPALADEGGEIPPADEGQQSEEAADPAGFLDIVFALSAEFVDYGVSPEQVQALHDAGIGLGDIFKLQLMVATWPEEDGPISITDLLAGLTNEDGELDLGFGEWKHSLTAEQMTVLEGLPRNLGQVVAAAHRSEHAGGQGHGGEGHGQDHGHGQGHGGDGDGGD